MYDHVKERIRGINAIPVTPFDEYGHIDYPALSRNLEYLLQHGMEAIYPCGNTGEYYALSLSEVKEVAEYTVKQAAGRAKVMVGIGYDARTASELAIHAETIGADGLMLHQPVHPFQSEQGLITYYQEIAQETNLPILLYVRQETVSIKVLAAAAAVPNIIGVKYAVKNLSLFAKAVQEIGDEFVWICGLAEMWAPFFFAAGAVGFTSGMVNVDPSRSIAMLHALRGGAFQEAMKVWNEIRPFEEMREENHSSNNVSVVKEAMEQLGLGRGYVRPPISRLSEDGRQQVRTILRNWTLLENKQMGKG